MKQTLNLSIQFCTDFESYTHLFSWQHMRRVGSWSEVEEGAFYFTCFFFFNRRTIKPAYARRMRELRALTNVFPVDF